MAGERENKSGRGTQLARQLIEIIWALTLELQPDRSHIQIGIDTDLDPADALITCSVNGQLRQMGSTRDLVFPVYELIAYISSIMTLEPGDVVLTGTPSGVGPLLEGDQVSVEIDGIGTLTNPVRSEIIPE